MRRVACAQNAKAGSRCAASIFTSRRTTPSFDLASRPDRFRPPPGPALHGAWERAPLPHGGFNVTFQPMRAGRSYRDWSIFADGFQAPGRPGSPAGLAVGPDGSLCLADDAGRRIWRIMPH